VGDGTEPDDSSGSDEEPQQAPTLASSPNKAKVDAPAKEESPEIKPYEGPVEPQ
jgi:hypothetical protein